MYICEFNMNDVQYISITQLGNLFSDFACVVYSFGQY